jgi:integrase
MLTIQDGFESWLDDAPDGKTGLDYAGHVKAFFKYLRSAKRIFPRTTDWSEVCKGKLLIAYRRWLEKQDYSLSTVKHRLSTVNSAIRHVFEITDGEYPSVSIKLRPRRIKRRPVSNEMKVLSMEQIGKVLVRAKACETLYGSVLLQLSAGLRCTEAFNVRCCDIDRENLIIEICETEHHTPKNESSIRNIPVGPFVMSELTEIPYVEPFGDWPITSPPKNLGAVWSSSRYGTTVKEVLLASGVDKTFQPRWLRATFATLARQIGCDRAAIQVYMGHRIPDIFGEHYEHLNAEYLRDNVALPVDDAIRRAVDMVRGP